MDVICYGVKQESTAVVAVSKIALNGLPTTGELEYLTARTEANGRVDVGAVNGESGAAVSLARSAALRGNKAVQAKATGTIQVRDAYDGADMLEVTLTEDGTSITREITEL